MWGWICQVCLIIVASEASDLYEMPFIFHSHTHRTSFKLNEGGGGGKGNIGYLTTSKEKHQLTWNSACKCIIVPWTSSFWLNSPTCHIFGHTAKNIYLCILIFTLKLKWLKSWMISLFLGILDQETWCWCYFND